jgi:steroid delta-isomerase-like uncharacterized protein
MTVPTQPTTSTTDAAAVAERYLEAWNSHEGAAVAAIVSGTYHDPTLAAPIAGADLATYVDTLCAAFPDLRFEHDGAPVVDGARVVAAWHMKGTNDGAALPSAPAPTGGTIDLAGIDVFAIADGKVASVQGYFDQKTFVEQLGLQAIVAPKDEWPVFFGLASRLDLGNTTQPGALSMTWIDLDPDREVGELIERTRDILTALAGEPGFIAFQSTTFGSRYLTLTAWTSPEAAESAVGRSTPHQKAMERVWQEGFGGGGFTSFWAPHRINAQFVRCAGCRKLVSFESGATTAACECGTTAEIQPYL